MRATCLAILLSCLIAGFSFEAIAADAPTDQGGVSASDWSQGQAATPEPVVEEAPVAEAAETAIEAPPTAEAAETPAEAEDAEMVDGEPETPLAPEEEQALSTKIDLDTIKLEKFYEALAERVPRDESELSLDECIRIALESNLDIQILSFGPEQYGADLMAAKGEFDPVGGMSASYTESSASSSAQTVVFGGISSVESFRTTGETSVSGKLHWGTQYSVGLNMDKEETTFNKFIEEWSGGATVSLTQPLLRGRGKAANMARIRVADNSRESAEHQLRGQVMNTLAEVIRAYWDLVGTVEELNVRKEAMANAERVLEMNERRFDIGTGAAIEVVQAKAGLATRQSDLISAGSQVLDASNRLRTLLNVEQGNELFRNRLVPLDRPHPEVTNVDVTESIDIALVKRPEIKTAELAIDSAKVQLASAANTLLPQLDVGGSVYQGGRNHKPRQVFYGIRDRDDNSFSVTMEGSVPLGNRTARGQHQRAKLDVRETEKQLEKTMQDIALSVRLAVTGVETSRILVESSKQTRALQEINVAAEEKRLQIGMTTSYQVLDVQEDLTAAQSQEVQSMINFEKSLVDLRLAEGTLLESLGIEFDLPEPEPAVSFVRSVTPFVSKE